MSPARNLMASKMVKRKKSAKRSSKTGFESFLEMDMQKKVVSAQEDLELERKLAKKLRVKRGKLGGEDDEFNLLFEDIPSVLDSVREERITEGDGKRKLSEQGLEDDTVVGDLNRVETDGEDFALGEATEEVRSRRKRRRKKKKTELLEQGHEGGMGAEPEVEGVEPVGTAAAAAAEEIPSEEAPAKATALEGSVKYVAPHLRSRAGNELEEHNQIRRQVRGLLNKLSEANMEKTAGDMSKIYHSVGRSVGSQIIIEEVLASCSGGPRGNEQYAAVFAAFVAGMACLVGIDFSAKLLASLAKSFEDEYAKKDDLSLRNLTLLFAYLYKFDVFASDLMYDFLIILSKQLLEIDVSTIWTILKCCWMKLRRDDPGAMKDFWQSVQSRVNELEASGGGKSNKRMGFMLRDIEDIKNNKKSKEETVQRTRINKRFQKLHVEDILIRGLKWSKLLDPDKKGQWWLSGNMISPADNVEEVAAKIDKEDVEARKIRQLAAALGMNTDARRAIFSIIIRAEDYLDAFEKLLGLALPGKQDREIMRVLLKCCLQEQVFNKYYILLAKKLCDHDRNHKFTLQYCLWDHFQELDSMNLQRSKRLAEFIVEMLSSFTLSLSVLKAVNLSDPRQLTPNRTMHFRMLFYALLEKAENIVWNVFTRIAVAPELGALRNGIQFFIREYVVSTNTAAAEKFKVAKKALNNLEGVLM